ncbi:MAG: anhydro-N-acetylmuramic acid kinase [Rickettsiales bacterium]|nr:anhydro-N-acetylmuramic acid kinase [Rickettsiales bacterium]
MNDTPIWAIGLMSGSSLDGIDVAAILSDGESVLEQGPSLTLPYDAEMQKRLHRGVYRESPDRGLLERDITLLHAEAVNQLLADFDKPVEVIGFHGQTIDHRPTDGVSIQIGNGALLAEKTGITVVNDFRSADIAAGGQGAPLVPLFHAALARDLPKPLAVINIGGIANISWLNEDGRISAFDTGPGNVLLNDWVKQHRDDMQCDEGGAFAAAGKVDEALLDYYLSHPYFEQAYPKSLDRNAFSLSPIEHLSLEEGAATLTAFTARSIALAAQYFPDMPKQWIFCGGGCHNKTMVEKLRKHCGNVVLASELGWDNDGLEAQAFAYFAVRALQRKPLTFPETTGATHPVSGGAVYFIS